MATSSLMPTWTSTFRSVPFALAVNSWTLSNNKYVSTFSSNFITQISKEIVLFDETLENSSSCILVDKIQNGGGLTFTAESIPEGTISGTIYVIDRDDGRIPVLLQNTVVPISGGGTGANNVAGAISNLGIDTLITGIENKIGTLSNLSTTNKSNTVAAINETNNNILTTCTSLINETHKIFTNIKIPVSAWIVDNTYANFPNVAIITLTGIDEHYFCDVILSIEDTLSGNFAPICESTSSGLKIWCATAPSSTLIIPTINCVKVI